mmetsp:Transcript_25597/g.80762  ORF Transcript_25597/g.80762 Transcript_25597/m.80762 type:complete len:302 (+) Transcript_25597:2312-3217(+)
MPSGFSDKRSTDKRLWLSRVDSMTRAPQKLMRFSETSRCVSVWSWARSSRKKRLGTSPATLCAAEQLGTLRERSRCFSTRHSPMWAKTSAVKQFQPRSKVSTDLLRRRSPTHSLAPAEVPRPTSARLTRLRQGCSRMASQSFRCTRAEMDRPLRFSCVRFRAPSSEVSKVVAVSIVPLPACTQYFRLNFLSVCTAWWPTRLCNKGTRDRSVSTRLPSRSSSSMTAMLGTATVAASSSWSTRTLSQRLKLREWPVTKGIGVGMMPLVSHSSTYSLVGVCTLPAAGGCLTGFTTGPLARWSRA